MKSFVFIKIWHLLPFAVLFLILSLILFVRVVRGQEVSESHEAQHARLHSMLTAPPFTVPEDFQVEDHLAAQPGLAEDISLEIPLLEQAWRAETEAPEVFVAENSRVAPPEPQITASENESFASDQLPAMVEPLSGTDRGEILPLSDVPRLQVSKPKDLDAVPAPPELGKDEKPIRIPRLKRKHSSTYNTQRGRPTVSADPFYASPKYYMPYTPTTGPGVWMTPR